RRSTDGSAGSAVADGGCGVGAVIAGEDTGKPPSTAAGGARLPRRRGSCDPVAMPAPQMPTAASAAAFATRIEFVVELAGQLHRYGTTAQRLEGAIEAVARRLGLDCEPWSNPTG